MFISKEGKFGGKVSIIDAFVVIAILVIGIGFFFRFISPPDRVITERHEIEYTMLVRSIRASTVRALQEYGYLSDGRTHEELGEIVGLTYVQALQEDARIDGTFGAFPVPDRYDVFLQVRVDGRVSETGYFTFQNRALTMGAANRIQTKHAATSGEIVFIRTVEEEPEPN